MYARGYIDMYKYVNVYMCVLDVTDTHTTNTHTETHTCVSLLSPLLWYNLLAVKCTHFVCELDKCVHLSKHHCANDLEYFLYPTRLSCPPWLLQVITELISAALE